MPAFLMDYLQIGAALVTIGGGLYAAIRWFRSAPRTHVPATVEPPRPISILSDLATDAQVKAQRNRAARLVNDHSSCPAAVELLSECIARRPQWAYLYELRGRAYMNWDRKRYRLQAITDFRSALRLNKDSRAKWPLQILLDDSPPMNLAALIPARLEVGVDADNPAKQADVLAARGRE